jgi:hypothetical protein
MEKGGTGPWHANDEHRLLDARSFECRWRLLRPPRVRKPQTRLQKIPQVNPHQEPAKRVQVGFLFQAPGENRKGGLQGRISEVLQAGSSSCLGT